MNNKWIWLVVGIIIGVYVVPMVKAKTSTGG
jgi:uncharacterized membrane-anchored protein YhcB (DUF1043 family)